MAAEDPHSNSPHPRRDGFGGIARQLAEALDMPFILVGAVVIGAGIGYFLDTRFGTAPILSLVLGAAGFAAGFWEILRRLTGKQKSDGQ